MKRLPKTREVIAEVMKIANAVTQTSSKTASTPVYATDVASEIAKLAAALRNVDPAAVTYEDVAEFEKNLLRQR
jgi:hypothetical protein